MKIWNYDLWYKLWKRLAKLLLYWNILTNMVSLGFSNQYVSLFQDRRIRYLNHLSKIFSLLRTCPRSVSVCVFVHCSFFSTVLSGFLHYVCQGVSNWVERCHCVGGSMRVQRCLHNVEEYQGLLSFVIFAACIQICLIWKTLHHNRSGKNKLLCHGFAIVLDSFLLMIQN